MARNRKRAKERRARRPQGVAATSRVQPEAAPNPIEHASPDVELAETQLALGRPELVEEAEPELEAEGAGGELGRAEVEAAFDDDDQGGDAAALAPPAARAVPGNRLLNFLEGSWRELQRVQWPDRRQVMQATGVVIGFVIIAGVFLGVADFFAGKVMNYVLTGHFK